MGTEFIFGDTNPPSQQSSTSVVIAVEARRLDHMKFFMADNPSSQQEVITTLVEFA